jgi:hypothetical protein
MGFTRQAAAIGALLLGIGNLIERQSPAAVLFVWLNYAVNAGSWLPYRNYLQEPA